MATITGTTGNDTLTVQTDTTSIQAGSGIDTVVFSGNYGDYTFSQSDSFVPLLTHNTTAQVVSLFGVELLQLSDRLLGLSVTSDGESSVSAYTLNWQNDQIIAPLKGLTWELLYQDGDGWAEHTQRHYAYENSSISYDAIIKTDNSNYLNNTTINY